MLSADAPNACNLCHLDRSLGWTVAAVPRGKAGGPAAVDETPVLATARSFPKAAALHDPGAVGLEPCLYVAGADASDVAARLLLLHDSLVTP